MSESQVCIRNRRDADISIGHESAVICPIFQPRAADAEVPHACLESIGSLTWHAVQGGQKSDYHQHENREQFYYVLSGTGEVLIEDTRYPVRPGSVAYFPPQVRHQLISDPENDFLEHLVVTAPVDRTDSRARVLNWRETVPRTGGHADAIMWRLLENVDVPNPLTDAPCLLSMRFAGRQALLRGKASNLHQHDRMEQLYYVLEGRASMLITDTPHHLAEGDAVYLPPGTPHRIMNQDDAGWLTFLVIS